MTQPGYRHRIIVMDRSGSIADILAGQQSGLGEFFRSEGQVPGKATYSLWDFDTEIRCRASLAPLDTVKSYVIEPRGGTAMYDAVGDAVSAEGEKLAALPEDERPEDVTVIIASDGLENRSQRRTGPEVRQVLSHQQDAYGWRVIYMGTNQDAFAEGAKMGAQAGLTVNYANSDTGSQNAWAASAAMLSRAPVAMASAGGYEFSEDERNLGESAGSALRGDALLGWDYGTAGAPAAQKAGPCLPAEVPDAKGRQRNPAGSRGPAGFRASRRRLFDREQRDLR